MKQTALAVIGTTAAMLAVRPAAAEPACEPVALVEGDPVLVSSLEARLVQRGIAIDEATPDGCPPVRAKVVRRDDVVLVTVVEPSGAAVDRSVTTADIAATWIESRVRHDVGAPLLAVRMAPVPTAAPGVTPAADVAAVAPAAGRGRDPLSIAVSIESGVADEDSRWRSYTASACARLGPLCVGALGRLADNPEQANREGFTLADRTSKELLATVAAPLRLGRVTVMPSLAAGVGWMTTEQIDEPLGEPPPECGSDPELPPGYCELPPPLKVTRRGGRFAVALSVSIPLADRVALDLGVSHQWVQGAHSEALVRDTGEYFPAPEECGPDGTGCCDPAACMDDGDPFADFVEYAGEPTRFLRAGLGLRVGLP